MPRDEEVALDVLFSVRAEPLCKLGLVDELLDPICRSLNRVGQNARIFMGNLKRDSADGRSDSYAWVTKWLGSLYVLSN